MCFLQVLSHLLKVILLDLRNSIQILSEKAGKLVLRQVQASQLDLNLRKNLFFGSLYFLTQDIRNFGALDYYLSAVLEILAFLLRDVFGRGFLEAFHLALDFGLGVVFPDVELFFGLDVESNAFDVFVGHEVVLNLLLGEVSVAVLNLLSDDAFGHDYPGERGLLEFHFGVDGGHQ